jgi:hypothetical protein
MLLHSEIIQSVLEMCGKKPKENYMEKYVLHRGNDLAIQ